ncbi:MAG: cytochrome b/b6 domain-containing protein [Acidobacteriia bacterium]|nr:cytochrome b/b6 domain-containing protein [Terriglobia bacterium]
MSEEKRVPLEDSLWARQDTAETAARLSRSISDSVTKELPKGLTEPQFKRLKKELLASLEKEMILESRRVIRLFLEEEEAQQKHLEKRRKRKALFEESVERISLNQRGQHMILLTCTLLLIITGLPIKFHEAPAAEFIIHLLGGPNITRVLHRIGAIGLTIVGLYHLWYCMAFEEGRRNFGLLLPSPRDLKDFLQQMGYYLGLKKDRPLFDRFSYIEKFDYWAVYWGMVVMITSGYILWFMETAINQFGKVAYDIAREAHSDEGLLATLAIIIWHFYNVHFNPKKFPGSLTWWHGRIPIEEFREEHPIEYERWLEAQKQEETEMEQGSEGIPGSRSVSGGKEKPEGGSSS